MSSDENERHPEPEALEPNVVHIPEGSRETSSNQPTENEDTIPDSAIKTPEHVADVSDEETWTTPINGPKAKDHRTRSYDPEDYLSTVRQPRVPNDQFNDQDTVSVNHSVTDNSDYYVEVGHANEGLAVSEETLEQKREDLNSYLPEVITAGVKEKENSVEDLYGGGDTSTLWTRKRKIALGGVVALFVIAAAVTVPCVLLLGKEDVILLPEGDDSSVPCPFRNGEATEKGCGDMGCIWYPSAPPWPSCFFPTNKSFYEVSDGVDSVKALGKKNLLVRLKSTGWFKPFGSPVELVYLHVDCSNENQVTLKISPDGGGTTENGVDAGELDLSGSDYKVQVSTTAKEPFNLAVTRTSSNEKIWESRLLGLVMEKGFIQVASYLPSPYVYGMSENWHQPSLLREMDIRTWPLFSRSGPADPQKRLNLNSVHPFYMNLESNGTANGVLFSTYFPSEYILLKAPGIVFRTIDKELEFTIFVGNSPKHVSELLNEHIGGLILPPLWALGVHVAPPGDPKETIETFRTNGISVDSVHLSPSLWTNENVLSSTYIKPSLVEYFRNISDIRWALTVSPSLSESAQYVVDVLDVVDPHNFFFIQLATTNGSNSGNIDVMKGMARDGPVVFYNFENGGAVLYWHSLITKAKKDIAFQGVVVDSNEPFNQGTNQQGFLTCQKYSTDSPPYPTAAAWGHGAKAMLSDDTVCMAGLHQGDGDDQLSHLKVHNRYGMHVAISTLGSCVTDKRCFVMSRSTAYAWSSDIMSKNIKVNPGTVAKLLDNVDSSWEGMRRSLISVLEFNMLGIPLVAPVICGNTNTPDEALCKQWLQLSTFYPVARISSGIQGLLGSASLLNQARKSFNLRLSLVLYTYSSLYRMSKTGEPLVRPLFYDFPQEAETRSLYTQFMYGPSLMVAPVLQQDDVKTNTLQVFFPDETWYRFRGLGATLRYGQGYQVVTDVEDIPMFARGGHIIPFHLDSDYRNVDSTLGYSLTLRVFPKLDKASGFIFVDDGESIDDEKSAYLFSIEYNNCRLEIQRKGPLKKAYPGTLHLYRIEVFGWRMRHLTISRPKAAPEKAPPFKAQANVGADPSQPNFDCAFYYDHELLSLKMDIDLTADVQKWTIDWSGKSICRRVFEYGSTDCMMSFYMPQKVP